MMKENAGETSPRPKPRVAGSRAEVSRGDPGDALPSRAKREARVLRATAGSWVGAGTRTTGHMVPRQPRGSRLQLAGRPDRPAPLTLTAPRGLGRDSARARARARAGRRRGRRGGTLGSTRAQVRRLGEEVVSALPFPRSAQTCGARRAALHRGATGAPGWRHTRGRTCG